MHSHTAASICSQITDRCFHALRQEIYLDFQFKAVPGSQPSMQPVLFSHFKNTGEKKGGKKTPSSIENHH